MTKQFILGTNSKDKYQKMVQEIEKKKLEAQLDHLKDEQSSN